MISPSENKITKVYCDMTTDGWGWSLIFNQHEIGDFWTGDDAFLTSYDIPWDTTCNPWKTNCVNASYWLLPLTNDIMLDGSQSNIIADNHTSRMIINDIDEGVWKTLYEIMNDPNPNENCKYRMGRADIVEKQDAFLLWWDSNSLFTPYTAYLCLNDKSNSGIQFIVGRSHTNAAGWPNNVYGNHYHSYHRLWIR